MWRLLLPGPTDTVPAVAAFIATGAVGCGRVLTPCDSAGAAYQQLNLQAALHGLVMLPPAPVPQALSTACQPIVLLSAGQGNEADALKAAREYHQQHAGAAGRGQGGPGAAAAAATAAAAGEQRTE